MQGGVRKKKKHYTTHHRSQPSKMFEHFGESQVMEWLSENVLNMVFLYFIVVMCRARLGSKASDQARLDPAQASSDSEPGPVQRAQGWLGLSLGSAWTLCLGDKQIALWHTRYATTCKVASYILGYTAPAPSARTPPAPASNPTIATFASITDPASAQLNTIFNTVVGLGQLFQIAPSRCSCVSPVSTCVLSALQVA